jgi:hypothetical protein
MDLILRVDMQDLNLSEMLAQVAQRQTITAEDVLTMRRNVFRDGFVSAEEAGMLFELNNNCSQQDASWSEFFIEALTDYCVHQASPAGYISEENARWLIDCIAQDGRVDSRSELELLIKALEKASSSPEKLATFALEQVKIGALEGKGPTRQGLELVPGVIGEAEVDILRRILYAFGGDGHMAITRAEAEVLFELNDVTDEHKSHVSWSDLFVKAIANFMMAASGYQPPSREVALKREVWLDQRDGISGFMSKMVSGGLQGIFNAYSQSGGQSVAEQRVDEMQKDIQNSERVTQSETAWLVKRIGRDGNMSENEQALIEFIKENSPAIHPSFKVLGETAA